MVPRVTPKRLSANVTYDEDDDEDDYEVDDIVAHQVITGENYYLVHWKGYSSKDNTWEPESALSCPELIAAFEKKPKSKKGKGKGKGGKTTAVAKAVVGAKKRGRPSGKTPAAGKSPAKKPAQKKAAANEPAYEVEKVVGSKMIRGEKHFQIRWKGYTAKDDTWEHVSDLNCPELIKQFDQERKKPAATKKGRKSAASAADTNGVEDSKDYEVEEIVDEKTERGKKLYLVKWKGYASSENTWEPETSLSCPDLVVKYIKEKKAPVVNGKLPKGKGRPAGKRSASSVADTATSPPAKRGRKSVTYAADVKNGDNDSDAEPTNGDAAGDDGEKEWEVEKIVDKRTGDGGLTEYLIRWKGCKASDDTWEPEDNVNSPIAVAQFEKSNTTKTRKKPSKRA